MRFWRTIVLAAFTGLLGTVLVLAEEGNSVTAWAVEGNSRTVEAAGPLGDTLAAKGSLPEAIPVLCYHRFGPYASDDSYFVTKEEFKHHLEIIKSEGFTPITASALRAGWEGKQILPDKPLLITVDDGYADFKRNALPLLQAYGYPATLFVYTRFLDSQRALSHEQLQALQKLGLEIGSHSATHPKLIKPTPEQMAAGWEEFLKTELQGSRLQLKEWLGVEAESLAYPYGLYNREVEQAARAAGYSMMFTVDQGTNDADTPRDRLKRIMIVHQLSDAMFRYLLHELPLKFSECSPAPGERVAGAVNTLTAVVSPEQRQQLDPKAWVVLKGGIKQKWAYDASTGKLTVFLSKPWTHGTDSVMAVGRDRERKKHFKETWMFTVTPAGK